MNTEEKVAVEIARLDEILRRRGAFYEDEQVRRDAFGLVALWIQEDKDEAARIEAEAAAAEELEREERRKNDPNFRTRELFRGVKIDVPKKENRR